MIVTQVTTFSNKYLDLLKKIDSGEYRIAKLANDFPGFERWVEKYTFDLDGNFGILASMIFKNSLRIQIAFEHDLSNKEIKELISIIDHIRILENRPTFIWLFNDNRLLVDSLMNRFNLTRDKVYMSHELMYFNEPQDLGIAPLKMVSYSDERLIDTLNLLEDSFVDISTPNSFINDKDYYQEKFSRTGTSRYKGFLLNDELIGMYFHQDGELDYLAVKTKFQSKGYGKLILHQALKSIKELSNEIPYLYCVDENEQGLKFYLREGFTILAHSACLTLPKGCE